MTTNINDGIIEAAIQLAFEAGRWQGQVDLEEHYDNEQYSQVLPEVFAARKTAMPNDLASTGRTVRVNLRSDEWRKGVKKSAREYLKKAKDLFLSAHPPAWQTIETAPKDGTDVLLWSGRFVDIGGYDASHGFWRYNWKDYESVEPTYWMPLPQPPITNREE